MFARGRARGSIEIRGRDLMNGGTERNYDYRTPDCGGLADPVAQIVEAVKVALEHTGRRNWRYDIVDKGIVLTGAAVCCLNLDQVLRNATGLPVSIAENRWPVWSRNRQRFGQSAQV